MKCSHCGKPIDDHTRFCPWCDHDNYPQMNRVQTKTTTSAQKRPSQKTAGKTYNIPHPNVPNQSTQNKANQNTAGCVVLIIVAVVLLIVFIGSLAASFSGI